MPKAETYIVLHNVRSVHNVGSIFRTADCLGVSNVFLCGYTPPPVDRFGRPRLDFAKVSLGAEKTVSWKKFKNINRTLEFLQKQKVRIIGVEQATNAKDYKKVSAHSPVAFIFGNEVAGIPESVLKKCDTVAEIPMRGGKESLNVSVAVGIALSRMLGL